MHNVKTLRIHPALPQGRPDDGFVSKQHERIVSDMRQGFDRPVYRVVGREIAAHDIQPYSHV